jgi:PPOX class probable FMN-dependent enzyme
VNLSYNEASRRYQDRYDTRRLADRIDERLVSDVIDDDDRAFIERRDMLFLATADAQGRPQCSYKGGAPGFVRVLDEHTLLLPERPGNRLADTLVNLLSDPRIALLFLIPGVGDTFRVNGTAVITDDRDLLGPCAVAGKVPRLGVLVTVLEAYTQCAKALIRSDLWNPERHIQRSALPSHGAILKSLHLPDLVVAAHDRARAQRYARREGLY